MAFDKLLRSYQGINTLARSLIHRPAFDEVNVLLPDSGSPEARFIRAASWLYCLYFEAGRVSITFLSRLGEAYDLIRREASDQHVEAVRCLRTELHHNLGFADSDLATRMAAEGWRRKACGTVLPRTTQQWEDCYTRIVDDACSFLGKVEEVVRRIESDGEGARQHVDDWLRRLERHWSAAAFDPLIDDTKYRFARESVNTVTFRKRHVDKWRQHLDLLEDGLDFEFEATRLIEKTFLDDDGVVLPITGKDLVEEIGVKPGPVIGALLEEARRYYEVYRCRRCELINHLRAYNSNNP